MRQRHGKRPGPGRRRVSQLLRYLGPVERILLAVVILAIGATAAMAVFNPS